MGNECYKNSRYYKMYNTPMSLISNTNIVFRNFICTYSQKFNYKPYRNYKMTIPDSPDIPIPIVSPLMSSCVSNTSPSLNNSPLLSPIIPIISSSNNSWTVSCPTIEIAIGGSLNNSPIAISIPMDNYIMNNYIKGNSPTQSDLSDITYITNTSDMNDFIVI